MNKILSLIAVCGLALTTWSCSDDDVVATPIATPETNVGNATYNTLTFNWEPVKGATQYAYEFSKTGETELIAADVVTGTRLTFTDLEPSTSYTLKVKAFGAVYSENGTSAEKVMEASTSDIIQLATPQLTITEEKGAYVVSWDAIEETSSYRYRVVDEEGELMTSGTQTATTLTLKGYDTGTYTVSVTATTKTPGYKNSETAQIQFSITRVERWRVDGTYTCGLDNQTWNATMVSYTDGTYSIKAFYGVEGYDFEFYMDYTDPDQVFYMSDSYEVDSDWMVHVPTGKSTPSEILVYPWWNYSEMTGDENGGEVDICCYTADWTGYFDTFVWDSPDTKLVGSYTATLEGWEAFTDENSDWVEMNWTYDDIEITKNDDGTLSIAPFVYDGETLVVTPDMENGVVIAQPQTFWTWYTVSANDSATEPFEGKITEGADGSITIVFTDFNVHYDEWIYFWEPVYTLTKK